MKIIFMGTPDFAAHSLKVIVEAGYQVVAVVTTPDKPSGRGQKLQESAVKIYAKSKGLKILQPKNLKSEEFLQEIKSLNPDIQVVVAFRMLPKSLWEIPKKGTFNLHASLLPDYRGAAPINWAIINGEEKTGVTTFFIDEKIDTGAIILKEETPISERETAGTLHDKLMIQGGDLILKTLEKIKNNEVELKLQPEKISKEAPKIFKETCKINFEKSVSEIDFFVRGMSPYPAAWGVLNQDNEQYSVKFFDVTPIKNAHNLPFGSLILEEKSLKIAVKEGFLQVNELQFPSKKRMKTGDFLNGFTLKSDSYFS